MAQLKIVDLQTGVMPRKFNHESLDHLVSARELLNKKLVDVASSPEPIFNLVANAMKHVEKQINDIVRREGE